MNPTPHKHIPTNRSPFQLSFILSSTSPEHPAKLTTPHISYFPHPKPHVPSCVLRSSRGELWAGCCVIYQVPPGDWTTRTVSLREMKS